MRRGIGQVSTTRKGGRGPGREDRGWPCRRGSQELDATPKHESTFTGAKEFHARYQLGVAGAHLAGGSQRMAPPKPREDAGRGGPKYDIKEDTVHL